jgi:hypothetical protein
MTNAERKPKSEVPVGGCPVSWKKKLEIIQSVKFGFQVSDFFRISDFELRT